MLERCRRCLRGSMLGRTPDEISCLACGWYLPDIVPAEILADNGARRREPVMTQIHDPKPLKPYGAVREK